MDSLLIYRAGFVGDICLASAAIREIRKANPESEITLACWAHMIEVMVANPNLNKIREVVTFYTSEFSKSWDIRHEQSPYWKGGKHYWGWVHAEQAANEAGLFEWDPDKTYKPEIYMFESSLAERHSKDLLCAISVWSTNGMNWRLWGLEKWEELIDWLHSKGIKVIRLGIKSEPDLPSVDMDMRGKTSLQQVMGILAAVDMAVCIDAGLGHMAHATKYVVDDNRENPRLLTGSLPTVMLVGPVPATAVVPSDGKAVVVSDYSECGQPCNTSFASPELVMCKYNNACMKNLSVEAVIEGVEEVLSKQN